MLACLLVGRLAALTRVLLPTGQQVGAPDEECCRDIEPALPI